MSENIAVVFPGQGSQSIGMLDDYLTDWPIVKETVEEASSVLGYDLWDIIANGPDEKLNQTEITQPAVLAADIAIMRVMAQQCMLKPFVFAGHSLGEYAALVAAGAIEFTDAIKLVAERGRLMQNAVADGEGAMAAIIGLSDNVIVKICDDIASGTGEVVSAVNFNSPGQVVIAGNTSAVEKAIEALKEEGAKRAIQLPVSVPSHCALMKSAADEFGAFIQTIEIKTPAVQVIQNVEAKSYENVDDIREALVKQMYCPVEWTHTIQIISDGADAIVECGPGKVLSGLTRRINKDVASYSLSTTESMQKFLDAM